MVDLPTILGCSSVFILCVIAAGMALLPETSDIENENLSDSFLSEIEYKKNAEISLSEINQKGIKFQENNDEEKFNEQLSLMQKKEQEVAQHYLGVNVEKIYLKENYNFPFKDASSITSMNPQTSKPACNIAPKIPSHLQVIQNSDLFLRFSEKYASYPITLEISDERLTESWVHYSLFTNSDDENYVASIFFHVNSCTNKLEEGYNLHCRNNLNDESIHSWDKEEIISSLGGSDFCKISFDPWKQALYDYSKTIAEKQKKHFESLETIQNTQNNYEKVKDFEHEMERLGRLANLVGHAMNRELEDKEFQEMIKEYNNMFGDLPEEFLKLLEMPK